MITSEIYFVFKEFSGQNSSNYRTPSKNLSTVLHALPRTRESVQHPDYHLWLHPGLLENACGLFSVMGSGALSNRDSTQNISKGANTCSPNSLGTQ